MNDKENKKTGSGGMYRGVDVPVKLLDAVIGTGIAAIVITALVGMVK